VCQIGIGRGAIARARIPVAEVWREELVPMLQAMPNLRATTLLEELQRHHPGDFPDRLLSSLQRRVAHWRATEGPERELVFRQEHSPGLQALSDFTDGVPRRIIPIDFRQPTGTLPARRTRRHAMPSSAVITAWSRPATMPASATRTVRWKLRTPPKDRSRGSTRATRLALKST